MGETTNEIENYIDSTRDDLGSNIRELEQKVKSVTDWRGQFQKNPMTGIAVAFGGGVLMATMIGGSKRRSSRRAFDESTPASTTPHTATAHQKHKALELWDNIQGALIGVAATKVKDFIGDVVPGFHEQLHMTEKKTTTPTALNPGL